MNAKRKTYGVSGYMEWVALIECGKATVKVHFSGGSLTGYGVTPAEFTTQNPMTQAIIENSKEFKSGKIFLLREIEGTGKFKEFVRGQHANEGNHLGWQAATASAIAGTALDDKSGGVETPSHRGSPGRSLETAERRGTLGGVETRPHGGNLERAWKRRSAGGTWSGDRKVKKRNEEKRVWNTTTRYCA